MVTGHKILIIDDDKDLRDSLKENLSLHDRFEVMTAETGVEGIELVKSGRYELVLFDVALPDMDGRDAVRYLRSSGLRTPIIMLTGKGLSDSDEILGLDAGANDYITKPFKFPILLARIRAQIRQREQGPTEVFPIGPYSFRPASKLLVDERGRKIRLTEKEILILRHLYWAGNRTVPREMLLRGVWGDDVPLDGHMLETHIYRLRQKVEKNPARAEFLVTDGSGYKLVR
jgi:DNA-binding response OmpR family regulator